MHLWYTFSQVFAGTESDFSCTVSVDLKNCQLLSDFDHQPAWQMGSQVENVLKHSVHVRYVPPSPNQQNILRITSCIQMG